MINNSVLLRVMSFNIRYENTYDVQNPWKNRREKVASMINFHHADVAGLQEALKNQMDDLVELLPDYGWIGVGRDDGNKEGEFAPVFYRKNRFEPVNSGTFWLSETPGTAGSKGWDAACIRIATWVEFIDKMNGKTFFHFNTHFDHEGQKAMVESSYLLLHKVETLAGDKPVVVTGDFNNGEDSDTYKILTGKHSDKSIHNIRSLNNSRYCSLQGHHGPVITFHNFRASELFECISGKKCADSDIDNMLLVNPIDYIFIKNNIKVLRHGVLADNWDGRYPSDHMPVVADIIIKEQV